MVIWKRRDSLNSKTKPGPTNKQPAHFTVNRILSLPFYHERFRTYFARDIILHVALFYRPTSSCFRYIMICLWKGKIVLLLYDLSLEGKTLFLRYGLSLKRKNITLAARYVLNSAQLPRTLLMESHKITTSLLLNFFKHI